MVLNRVVQHIPAFVDTREPAPSAEFTTMNELLAVPFVAQWLPPDEPGWHAEVSADNPTVLMAVKDDGSEWWVIGFLSSPVDLPTWVGPGTSVVTAPGDDDARGGV